jgi:hypothetical protein
LRKFEFDWSTHPLAFRNVPTAELSFLDISSMLSQLPQPQGLVKRNSIGIEIMTGGQLIEFHLTESVDRIFRSNA